MPVAALYWAACFGPCGEKENYFQADFWIHSFSVKYIPPSICTWEGLLGIPSWQVLDTIKIGGRLYWRIEAPVNYCEESNLTSFHPLMKAKYKI